MTVPAPTRRRQVRCAIYTRKSTEEGLEQAFNSLDAQREACAAYILSQKHEGWTALPALYDDGGFSGGTMERPALKSLLGDVTHGRIDVVVVYKVDRLTRALADFARIVAIFDAAEVYFVSVTQAFNTTTSMGRLTLNVLLSFAQFEREVTAERIRDKVRASKAKGMWMGGTVPIGFRVEARRLVSVPEEAALVRRIYERYLALGSVGLLKAELDRSGILTPIREHRNGKRSGAAAFSRGQLYCLIANPLFIGQVRHKDAVHAGQHAAIIEETLWQAVQDRLAANRRTRYAQTTARAPSPLAGKLFDPDGAKMRPGHANKRGRRYRYYVSADLIDRGIAAGAKGWRIPAGELEAAVARAIAIRLREPGFQTDVLAGADAGTGHAAQVVDRLGEIADQLDATGSPPCQDLLRRILIRVDLRQTELRAKVRFMPVQGAADAEPTTDLSEVPPFQVAAAIWMHRRGPELRLVLQGAAASKRTPDPRLMRTIIEGRIRASNYLAAERGLSVSDIAHRDNADVGDVSRSLQYAFLAPDLVERILDGTQPLSLTAERLKRTGELPLLWDEQRTLLD
jgi:DNA invertase Pin-like site-specific DNA recombinase